MFTFSANYAFHNINQEYLLIFLKILAYFLKPAHLLKDLQFISFNFFQA